MNPFSSNNAYWEFVSAVEKERRWIIDGKAGQFLAGVRATSQTRTWCLPSGHKLWRAQLASSARPVDEFGNTEEEPCSETRMIPDPRLIRAGGRANPPGFAYLYLATTEKTALAEMRPSLGECVTLAIFEIKRPVKLVVCDVGQEDLAKRVFDENPSDDERVQYVWNDIGRAFARPVNRDDESDAYIPTQILVEIFKAEGFDGVAYRSGLGRGTNIVLFDREAAEPVRRFLYALKKVRYEFAANEPRHAVYWEKDGVGHSAMEISTESPTRL